MFQNCVLTWIWIIFCVSLTIVILPETLLFTYYIAWFGLIWTVMGMFLFPLIAIWRN